MSRITGLGLRVDRCALLIAIGCAALPCAASAQTTTCVFQEAQHHGDISGTMGTFLGESVSTDGTHAAVGAPWGIHPVAGVQTGAVNVYTRQSGAWGPEAVLYPSVIGAPPMYFGQDVALDGDTLVVSDGGQGMDVVYVFRRGPSGWVEEAQVAPPDGAVSPGGNPRQFGYSIALHADTLLVGARRDDDFAPWSGAAYVFRRSGTVWNFEQKLHAVDPTGNAAFGQAVALDGDDAIIGAPGRFKVNFVTGAAYVFAHGAGVWNSSKVIELDCCSGSYTHGQVGEAVDIAGDQVAVGTVGGFMPEFDYVVAYARSAGVWTKQQNVKTQQPSGGNWYGRSLSFASESLLAVADATAWGTTQAGFSGSIGQVELFERVGSTWTGIGEFTAPVPLGGAYYGNDLSAAGQTIAIGAPGTMLGFNKVGAAHFLRIGILPEAYCTAKTNSQGCVPAITWSGSTSVQGSGFNVGARDVVADQVGLLIWSRSAGSAPFGGGTLCLGSPVIRTGGQGSGHSGPGLICTGAYSFDFTPTFLIVNALLPGTDVHAQYWSRDTGFAAANAIGLTNAVRFSICP